MSTPNLSLVYNYRPAAKNADSAPLVLMIHGYGSHENDLFGMADALPPEMHIVSVRAPRSMGFGGFAWYEINFAESGNKINNIEQAEEARDMLRTFVREFRQAFALPQNPLWLFGFSQGTILSYAYALNYPTEVQKVIALSGYVLSDIIPEKYKPAEVQHLDFFVSHGTEDPVLPIQAARQSVEFLERLNVSHQYREYPVGHGVAPENFRDLQQWIAKRLQQ